MKKPLIYLASPHSHPDPKIREERYKESLKCHKWLVENGFWVFSPIVHSHHCYGVDKEQGWEYWKEFDTEMITKCDEVWVLAISGTFESVGIRAEMEIAKLQGKKIAIIAPKIWMRESDYIISEFDPSLWAMADAQTS